MNTVTIPSDVLATLLDMANQHTQDIESGIEEGIYNADDNQDLAVKNAAISTAEALVATRGKSSVPVKYWDCYHSEYPTADTHQMDLDDQRESNGQMYVDVGSIEGHLDDMLGITVEVNTSPLDGITHTACAHIHFDGDNLAVSLFKIGDKILVRPETGVTIEPVQHEVYGVKEQLFWIDSVHGETAS